MAVKSKSELKKYFKRGAKPTESQFGDLIDSLFEAAQQAAAEQFKVLNEKIAALEKERDALQAEYEACFRVIEANFQSQEDVGTLKRV